MQFPFCFSSSEFLNFVLNQEQCMKKWYEDESATAGLQSKLKNLSNESVSLEHKLKHARTQIDKEIRKRKSAEQDKENLVRPFLG